MTTSQPHLPTASSAASAPPGGHAHRRSRAPAALGLAALGWVVAATVGAGVEDGSSRFYAAEAVWLLAQVALLVGVLALRALEPHGPSRAGRVALLVIPVGAAVFVLAEAVALATGETQDALLPVAALLTSAGFLVLGVAVLRAGRWSQWRRFVPLAVGLVPCFVMFPFAAVADGPSALALAAWGVSFGVLGLAAHQEQTRAGA